MISLAGVLVMTLSAVWMDGPTAPAATPPCEIAYQDVRITQDTLHLVVPNTAPCLYNDFVQSNASRHFFRKSIIPYLITPCPQDTAAYTVTFGQTKICLLTGYIGYAHIEDADTEMLNGIQIRDKTKRVLAQLNLKDRNLDDKAIQYIVLHDELDLFRTTLVFEKNRLKYVTIEADLFKTACCSTTP